MKKSIHVLLLEDREIDAETVIRELRRADFDPQWKRVETEADYLAGLESAPDLILSDFSLPRFDAMAALRLLQESGKDIPFIIVSGTIGEETAVEALKLGAADCVNKEKLPRLGPAVEHALTRQRERDERRAALAALEARERQQAAVARLGQDALAGLPVVVLMEEVVLLVARALQAEYSDILEPLPDRETMALRAGTGWREGLVGHATVSAEADGQAGFTLAAGQPVIVADLREETRFRVSPWLGEHGVVSGLSVIIGPREAPFGILGVHTAAKRDFTGEDVNFLQSIANVLASAIERARALDRVRDQAQLLDLAQDAIIVRGFDDGTISFWNRGAERLYGWTAAEACGREMGHFIFSKPAEIAAISNHLLQHGEWRGELYQVTKNGSAVVVSGRATLVRADDGAPKSMLIINSDLTEQKKIEAQFLRAQRLESIGTLASGVAHDLNNIIAPILMSAPMLRRDLPPALRDQIASTIEKSAQRGAKIIKQVLTFGRGLEGERRPLALGGLIDEEVKILSETFPKDVTVEVHVEPELWPILGDATQIDQVLLNLCVNARDAMPGGGQLRIAATNIELDASYCSMLPGLLPGRYVLLEVADGGEGIPPGVIERIFDPFFTTKGVGKGTGLGLSTVLGIVKSHGGTVDVASRVGKGTTFKIYLPAALDPAGLVEDPAPSPAPVGDGETILVVDDEQPIREAVKQVLELHGYRVLLAADGTEALAVFAENAAIVGGVLTDIAMPFMDGMALIRALQKMAPGLPVIASTGQSDKARIVDLHALKVQAVLHKPYGTETVLRALAAALHPPTITHPDR